MKRARELLLAAWIAVMAPAFAYGAFEEAGPSTQVRRAAASGPTSPAAHPFGEIAHLAADVAQQTPGGARLRNGRRTDLSRGADAQAGFVAARADDDMAQARIQQGARGEPPRVHAPALPEPANWMLLLSGLAVIACIARRRASMTLR
jgi:hypothetical protein